MFGEANAAFTGTIIFAALNVNELSMNVTL